MAKTLITKIDTFDGIAEDIRNPKGNQLGNIEHFVLRDKKLIPNRSTEAIETKSYDITKFAYAPYAAEYSLYGFGIDGSTARCYEIEDPTATSPSWTAVGSTQSGTPKKTAFEYYKNYIYFYQGTTELDRLGALSGARVLNSYQTLTAFSHVAQSVHHPADDIFYMFRDNIVAKQTDNSTGFVDNIQTVPDIYNITSATAFGNYLAIGCAPKESLSAKSVVFLWNRDSSLTTFSHKYDVGNGDLRVLANVGGQLIAVVDEHMRSGFALGRGAAVVYRLEGGEFVEKHRLDHTTIGSGFYTDDSATAECNKQETGDAVYWAMKLVRGDDTINGIWKYDNKNRLSVAHTEEDDGGSGIFGFLKLGNYWWIAHSGDGSVNRTDDQANFTFTSKADTAVIGDGKATWQTKGFTVFTEPLPSGGQIVVKYRKDNESSFSSALLTSATAGDIRHEIPQINMPHFKEIQFRVESTGGAVITGMYGEHEEITDSRYL